MDNLMDLIFGIIYNDHDSDLIGRDQVDDYTIDTCLTADQGYEKPQFGQLTIIWLLWHVMLLEKKLYWGIVSGLIDVKAIPVLLIAFSLSAMFYFNIRSLLCWMIF